MKIIEADHDRLYDIPGVPGPARKPVDIDAAKTGFQRLRSLRIYSFAEGGVVDGHAEDDEVFVIVTSGSVKMKIATDATAAPSEHTLIAATDRGSEPFAAYLPPHSVYQLAPLTAADVAYARAIPVEIRSPAVFSASAANNSGVLLDEHEHADVLRLKVLHLQPKGSDVVVDLPGQVGLISEALVHVQGSLTNTGGRLQTDADAELPLQSWQTVAFDPGEHAMLHVSDGSDLLVLAVLAA